MMDLDHVLRRGRSRWNVSVAAQYARAGKIVLIVTATDSRKEFIAGQLWKDHSDVTVRVVERGVEVSPSSPEEGEEKEAYA